MKKQVLLTTAIFMSAFNLFGQGKKNTPETDFKFNESKEQAVFTCSHVLDEKNPILYVEHDHDGDWQF